ncbi:MAG: hypothetical protein AAF616_11215 [Bacteroidota bacterium]
MILLFLWGIPGRVSGQDNIYQRYDIYRNPIRVILNMFSITATTGYGATFYSHDLNGVFFYQDAQGQYIFNNNVEGVSSAFIGYSDWLNNPSAGLQTTIQSPFDVPFDYLPNPVNNPLLTDQAFLVNTDTTDFGFRGTSHSVPLNAMLHFNYKKFRLGIGYSYERQFVRPLEPTQFMGQVRSYQPNFKSTRFTRLYGMAGYKFYSWWWYDFVAEVNVGRINQGPNQFNRAVISKGLYYNLGVSIEHNWSEYFRIILKPSIDFKSYTVSIPDGSSVRHRQPTFFLQVGVSINIPDIRRSPMKSDHTQLKHVYTDRKTGRREEVRGQPITKRQNPKIGENHRRPNQHMPSRKNRVKRKKRN